MFIRYIIYDEQFKYHCNILPQKQKKEIESDKNTGFHRIRLFNIENTLI